jgi:hypothetical protein
MEQGKNFTYEIFPESEGTLHVKCVINVLSSQHNKSHFRVRFQLADVRTNEVFTDFVTWTNPIWVVSKPKLTAGTKRLNSSTKRARNTSAPEPVITPATIALPPTTIYPTPIDPSAISTAPFTHIQQQLPPVSCLPTSNNSSEFRMIMEAIQRVLQTQDNQQKQLDSLQQRSEEAPPVSKKRSHDSIEEEIESDFDNAFRHIKRAKYEELDNLRKIAEKHQEQIRILYHLLPEQISTTSSELSFSPQTPHSTSSVTPTPLQNSYNNPPQNIPSASQLPLNSSLLDFTEVEPFFSQLDEFIWTE